MFKVFAEETKATNLKLIVDEYSGNVDVVAVADDGEPLDGGYICGITPEGTLVTYSCVNSDIVEVDDANDCIKVEDE